MDKLFVLVRLLLFFLSCYGYIQYLRKTVRPEFCIGLLFSCIVSVLFLAGILNLLRLAAWVLFVGGLILAGLSVKQKIRISDLICGGTVFFLLLAALFPLLLYGSKFETYDNFTHWAMVARAMIEEGRFPNFSSPFIAFSSYPLGSTIFIFYFIEIVGFSTEWLQMYAQAILMAGMTVSLFSFAKGRISTLIAAVFSVFLLCSNSCFFDLPVDNLLALSALGVASFCLYYGRDLKDRLWCFVPYAVFLMNVKNSGLLFVIVLCGYLWFALKHEEISLKKWLILFAVPIVTLILWQKHVSLVFPSGMSAPHSMSISYYFQKVQEKQLSDILQISKLFTREIVSLSNRGLWTLLAGLVCWLVIRRVTGSPCKEFRAALLLSVVTYVLYQIGMLGMYLFSMTTSEALVLASYDRYHRTVITFMVGLILVEILRCIHPTQNEDRKAIPASLLSTVLVVLAVIALALSPDFSILQRQQLEGTMRAKYDQLISDYGIPQNAEMILVTRKDDRGYLIFLTHYLLRPQQLIMQTEDELTLDGLSYIDVIIFFDRSEKTDAYLSELSQGYTDPVFYLY